MESRQSFSTETNAALAEVGRQLVDEIRDLVGAIRGQLLPEDPREAAKQTAGNGPAPVEIRVPLDEANVSPYAVNGYPVVRYQLPDGRQVVWRVDQVDGSGEPLVRMHVDDPKSGAKWDLEFVEVEPGDDHDR